MVFSLIEYYWILNTMDMLGNVVFLVRVVSFFLIELIVFSLYCILCVHNWICTFCFEGRSFGLLISLPTKRTTCSIRFAGLPCSLQWVSCREHLQTETESRNILEDRCGSLTCKIRLQNTAQMDVTILLSTHVVSQLYRRNKLATTDCEIILDFC